METLTGILIRNCIRLFDQVHLESHEKLDLVGLPRNRDHGQQIHKRLTATPIVDERDLRFALKIDHVLQVQNGVVIHIFASLSWLDVAVRRLQKPTVASEDHVLRVAGQTFEVVRAVHDRTIVSFSIAHDEGAGQVHGANIDFRIGASGNSHLN